MHTKYITFNLDVSGSKRRDKRTINLQCALSRDSSIGKHHVSTMIFQRPRAGKGSLPIY
ncbi:hypothetical protein KSC_071590 [Ktedonobacter sp. SOSP1-52]|nr:hypothetical protein KSC_071590 [Ktedonobacter sp. SOSP1-52]